ncbi:MAG: flagellar hook-basal body complex protein FliE [Ignavibacteria bacterium]|jgi:flagellar hook-basal body complex protein FliE|nr:flagellar hook-basal body complex protein FliE [Ignavibacteria bacterium]MCU7502583.1 flagellar hook-basal body complex protein FliE [Ignavibacteria bacterium]MCU7515214.1 flagellar hook-basal body complex protein FliE [Ignavibacteria bacterium]
MKIGSIQNIFREIPQIGETKKKEDAGFGDMLSSFIKDVNQDQVTAMNKVQDFADGKDIELHEVMVAGEKAKTSLELLMELRNKAVDMYKELTRIQV